MKHTQTDGIDIYRVQMSRRKRGPEPWNQPRRPTHWWSRTWQAEWAGCDWAPRAYTRRGIERRAGRWYSNGGRPAWQIRMHRWVRRNVTRRRRAS